VHLLLVPCIVHKHSLVHSQGPCVTNIFLTFSVLAKGGGGACGQSLVIAMRLVFVWGLNSALQRRMALMHGTSNGHLLYLLIQPDPWVFLRCRCSGPACHRTIIGGGRHCRFNQVPPACTGQFCWFDPSEATIANRCSSHVHSSWVYLPISCPMLHTLLVDEMSRNYHKHDPAPVSLYNRNIAISFLTTKTVE
jgi:hypothetical protein